jgi:nucleoside-diphosphate-sugar epimerase
MIRFCSELAVGRPIEVHRGSVRSWLHISDAVKAIVAAADVREHTVINIGHPDVVPIDQLAELVRRELGVSRELVKTRDLPPRMTAVKRPTLDRMRSLLGVVPAVSLDQGIRLVCQRVKERVAAGEKPL